METSALQSVCKIDIISWGFYRTLQFKIFRSFILNKKSSFRILEKVLFHEMCRMEVLWLFPAVPLYYTVAHNCRIQPSTDNTSCPQCQA